MRMQDVLFVPGLKKKRWEVKIKLSWYTPIKPEEVLITPEVSTLTKITLENIFLE